MAAKKKSSRTKQEPAPLKFPPSGQLKKNWDKLVRMAVKLPNVDEDRSYGTPALKTKNKLIARLRSEAEGGLAIRCDLIDRHMLMQADPEVFYITDHYAEHAMVLIDLDKVRWDAIPSLLEQAWRMVSTKKAIAEFDAA